MNQLISKGIPWFRGLGALLLLLVANCGSSPAESTATGEAPAAALAGQDAAGINEASDAAGPEAQEANDPEALEARSIDGTGNNRSQPLWGSAGIRLERLAPAAYADGVSEPGGAERPNPRAISNAVVAQDESIPNARGLSAFMFVWGQFLDHDLDLSMTDPNDPLPIEIPLGDPFFDPSGSGEATMAFSRSVFDSETGSSPDNPRQQLNVLTAWIDGSQVYGSDAARAAWLRSGVGGRLKTSEGDLLPLNDGTQANAPSNASDFFVAGDLRVNEQTALAAIHTLFVREHNRLAAELQEKHPDWDDERLYQEARRWVGAFLQSITFHEFLPALLGKEALGPYRGYDPTLNPNILNEFSTAFFRVGHTMLTSEIPLLDENGQSLPSGDLSLQDAFFNVEILKEQGLDPLLRGLLSQKMEEIDSHVVSEVRNFLFGAPGSGGLDLPSLNLQRGRDHGLPDYNTLRVALGLKPIADFSELSSDLEVQAAFREVYASVDDVDPWIGALAEDHVDGAGVGPTLKAALLRQFEALRHGDRFWYENDPAFSREDRRRIAATRLSDILRRDSGVSEAQAQAFEVPR
ncbi:MAG: peroxidase family protein [Deltaproteobacteria bacterium]|nr:peroxidase family protein [Deltaproteobacteria bacterium]